MQHVTRKRWGLDYEGMTAECVFGTYVVLSIVGVLYMWLTYVTISNRVWSLLIIPYVLLVVGLYSVYAVISQKRKKFLLSPLDDFIGIMAACFFVPNYILFILIKGWDDVQLKNLLVSMRVYMDVSDFLPSTIAKYFHMKAYLWFFPFSVLPALALSGSLRDIFLKDKQPLKWIFIATIALAFSFFLSGLSIIESIDELQRYHNIAEEAHRKAGAVQREGKESFIIWFMMRGIVFPVSFTVFLAACLGYVRRLFREH